ncbi:MAG: response regulator [Acidiferrobacterales bacterium]
MAGALILIVEDNPKDSKLIRDVLRAKGYETIDADTGEAGIELARERQPALILMDVMLPGMDGREAMKVLKGHPKTGHIPIIALTSFAMKGDRESLLASGFDGYIAKPIDIKQFPKLLENYLGGRS